MNEELKKACELLRYFQKWRRGGDGEMPNPREVGIALDLVLVYVEGQHQKDFVTMGSTTVSFSDGWVKDSFQYCKELERTESMT